MAATLPATLTFLGLRPGAVVGPNVSEPVWEVAHGSPLVGDGAYELDYRGRVVPPRRLWLCFGDDARDRVDVTSVPPGGRLTLPRLHRVLQVAARRNLWSRNGGARAQCWLGVTELDRVVERSEPRPFPAPVAPWTGAPDPAAFSRDPSITYVSARDAAGKERFAGRQLVSLVPGLGRFFVFKQVLETDPARRGFACIGFVNTLFDVPLGIRSTDSEAGGSKVLSTYGGGKELAAYLGGSAFDWPGRPAGMFKKADLDVAGDQYDKKDGFVVMKGWLLERFLLEGPGRTGLYVVWTGGHVGLVRDGVLYECKPPGRNAKGEGRGFCKTPYETFERSSVFELEGNALKAALADAGTFYVSRVTRPLAWRSR